MTSTLHWDVRNYMKELRHGRLQVLLSLILHSNIRGRAWPKTETLMEESGYNDKTLITQAKEWLFEHKAFVYVPVDKRVGIEEKLHNRHQVYQLTGFIEINGEIKPYLFVNPETEAELQEAVHAVLGDYEIQSRVSLLRDSLSSESLPHKIVQEDSKDNTEKDIADTPQAVFPSSTPKASRVNPYYDAIEQSMGITGGRNQNTQKMLEGKATKAGYKEYNLSPPMLLSEFLEYAAYAKKELGKYAPISPEKVQDEINKWRKKQLKKSAAAPSSDSYEFTPDYRSEAEAIRDAEMAHAALERGES